MRRSSRIMIGFASLFIIFSYLKFSFGNYQTELQPMKIVDSHDKVRAVSGLKDILKRVKTFQDPDYNPEAKGNDPSISALTNHELTPYVECSGLKELERTYICVFSERKIMNAALLRASFYSEVGIGFVNNSALFGKEEYSSYFDRIAGHAPTSQGLIQFMKVYDHLSPETEAPVRDAQSARLLEMESSFLNDFVKKKLSLHGKEGFTLVAVAAGESPLVFSQTASYQLLHAQFLQSEKYRSVVKNFWKTQVSPESRRHILKVLAQSGYKFKVIEDENFTVNLFQASVLTGGQSVSVPKELTPALRKYAKLLRRDLRNRGLQPLSVSVR